MTRMLQRGLTEAEVIASAEVPYEREIVVAKDTGAFWIGNGVDVPADLPKQGPISVDPVTGLAALPSGELLPTADPETRQLPDVVRAVIAMNLADPGTPEGAALAAVIADSGGGASSLAYDPNSGLYGVPDSSGLIYNSASGLYTTN